MDSRSLLGQAPTATSSDLLPTELARVNTVRMTLAQITLTVFALLMETGGIIGFFLKGSKPSLIAGAASGVLLIVAFAVTFFNMRVGLWIGAVVSLLLCLVFLIRLARTRKFMPSGMLLILSVAASVILLAAVLGEAEPPGP